MQTRRRLPKVNRDLAAKILENEEVENDKKDANENETKKPSKKKKGFSSELFQDERFASLFKDKVSRSEILAVLF